MTRPRASRRWCRGSRLWPHRSAPRALSAPPTWGSSQTPPCTVEGCLKEASHTPCALPPVKKAGYRGTVPGGCPGDPLCGLSARSAGARDPTPPNEGGGRGRKINQNFNLKRLLLPVNGRWCVAVLLPEYFHTSERRRHGDAKCPKATCIPRNERSGTPECDLGPPWDIHIKIRGICICLCSMGVFCKYPRFPENPKSYRQSPTPGTTPHPARYSSFLLVKGTPLEDNRLAHVLEDAGLCPGALGHGTPEGGPPRASCP